MQLEGIMETNKSIGEKIVELRKVKGCTQADLGAYLNISYQAVSKWERGESCPDFTTMSKLAQYFGVPISYFEDGGEKNVDVESLVVKIEKPQPPKEELSTFVKCPFCGRDTFRAHIYCDYCRGYFGDRFGAELPKPKTTPTPMRATPVAGKPATPRPTHSSQIKYCGNCGSVVGAKEFYCPKCHAIANSAGSVRNYKGYSGGTNGWAIAAIICVGLLGLIFGIIGVLKSEETGTGKTLSIVAIVLSLLWLVFCVCVYFGMGADCSSLGGGYYY